MASWEDTFTILGSRKIPIARGQLVTTLSVLACQLRCSKQTVISFLKLLGDTGMIMVNDSEKKCTIITINNYNQYQPGRESLLAMSAGLEVVHELTNKNQEVDQRLDPFKERNNNYSSYALTREANEKFYEEIKTNEDFWEDSSVGLCTDPEELRLLAEQFFGERLAKAEYYRSRHEVEVHLFNWLRAALKREKKESQKNSKNIESYGKADIDSRRGCDAPPPRAEGASKGRF